MKLWRPRHLTPEQLEERRMQAANLLRQDDCSQVEIARWLGVSPAAVSQWAEQFRLAQGNARTLRRKRHSGRPSRLAPADWNRMLGWLEEGALAAGYPTDRWTLPRIARLVDDKLGLRYTPRYIGHKLHELGWSVQCPIVQAKERDEVLVKAWLEKDWPRIKKVLHGT